MVVKINEEECIGCGNCVDVCPNNVLELNDVAKVKNPDACTNCGKCVEECPVDAITLEE